MKSITYIFVLIILATSLNPLLAQLCPGTPGQVQFCYWRGIPDDDMGELHAREFFPERPDGQLVLNSLKSPYRYDNYYGSFIRGYLRVPNTESITFNITGDDRADFYLSTNDQKDNLQKVAYLVDHTGQEEHDKNPEQTSSPIALVQDQYYYFELHHVEGGGSDHFTVWWKTSFTGLANWNYISTGYIYDVDCTTPLCQERGTPCNDGNALTSGDQYDGFCNCVGSPQTSNPCVGERSQLKAYYYDGISGNYLEDIYNVPNYPTLPDRGDNMNLLGKYRESNNSDFGSLIQGYLTVPVSGNYKFNITGDNQAIFFLSSNDDPANKQAHQILTDYSTGMTDHEDQIYQSTSDIFMETGRYYYFELNHKQGGSWAHYRLFWQTPFSYGSDWKEIPTFYLYDYECELACIPQGTPCDDGDPFTNNDQYDANCQCVGTPCSGPDCDDPIANYQPFDACGLTTELDNRNDISWISCTSSVSANPVHGARNWLQYDLGEVHRLYNTQVWNYNVPGEESNGINIAAIDYSLDGVNWTALGQFNWPDATGSGDYAGFVGPDFGGAKARYILITALDPQACSGLSKLAVTARQCGLEGAVCDDGNPLTYNDKFDGDCNCIGQVGDPMDCLIDSLILGDSLLLGSNYSAIRFLESESTIINNSSVTFTASESLSLNPGFEGEQGGTLLLQIGDCPAQNAIVSAETLNSLKKAGRSNPLIVTDHPDKYRHQIVFYVDQPGEVSLLISSKKGDLIGVLADHSFSNGGHYKKMVNTIKLTPGVYFIQLQTARGVSTEKMIIKEFEE